jgi:hypothetical protein
MIAGIISGRVKVTRVLKSGFIVIRIEKFQDAACDSDTLK